MNQNISSTSKCFIIPVTFLKASGMPIPSYPLLNENVKWKITITLVHQEIYLVPLNIKIT